MWYNLGTQHQTPSPMYPHVVQCTPLSRATLRHVMTCAILYKPKEVSCQEQV